MSRLQLIIRNAEYFAGDAFTRGDILVDEGKIVGHIKESSGFEAECSIDAANLYVLPGVIDTHVHLRDPGHTGREDFFTGTQAACAGGITTILEMPISDPPVYSEEFLERRVAIAREKSMVDFCFYGAAGSENLSRLPGLIEKGVIAFKTFLHPAPEGRAAEFTGLTVDDDGQLFLLLQKAASLDARFFFHAENYHLIRAMEVELQGERVRDNSFHYRSRPKIAEVESVSTLLEFAGNTGARIGISHVSCPEALEMIKRYKAAGLDVVAETCPHYLVFNTDHVDRFGAYAKCNPPFRSAEDVVKMWGYLRDGTVDIIGSDHAPYLVSEKERGTDIRAAYAGLPGIELFLPLMLEQVNQGKIDLEKLAQIMSVNAAKTFGLYPRKGSLMVGSDADFTIIDLHKEYRVDSRRLYTKSRQTALLFDGLQGRGLPVYTVSKGKILMQDGRVDFEYQGSGEYVKRGAGYAH